eukprot:jgi/Picsp_1/3621/NSC_06458-R1_pinus taeda anonymous locus 2_3592_01 genomic sequence
MQPISSQMRVQRLHSLKHAKFASLHTSSTSPYRLISESKRRIKNPRSLDGPNEDREIPSDTVPEGLVEKAVEEILASDPERIERIKDAANRVAELQIEQNRLAERLQSMGDPAEAESAMEQRAAEAAADIVARAEVKAAELMLQAAKLEADSAETSKMIEEMEKGREIDRLESVKGGIFSAAGGCLATLPLAVSDPSTATPVQLLASLGVAAICSFLFVRSDAGNPQIKGGMVAAFGLVRGLSQGQMTIEAASDKYTALPDVISLGNAAISMGQSMLLFGFCSVVLEFAARQSWLDFENSN